MGRGSYIDGRWYGDGTEHLEVTSPIDDTVVFSTSYDDAHGAMALAAARRAAPAWAATSPGHRAKALRRIQTALHERQEAIAQAICREIGKPLWEARGEAKGLAARVDLTLGAIANDVRAIELANGAGSAQFLPLGVVGVLGPFNFPAHLANGQILPALMMGNTVILKPSEKGAGVAELYAEAFAAAGLPDGVFNMIQGDHRAGIFLSGADDVDGLLFTGSTRVGEAILAATHHQPHKLVSLEMGGKNASIVLADAEIDQTAGELLNAAFITCGQRCTATSQVYVHRSRIDELAARLGAAIPKLRVGDPWDPKTFMGPIIDQASKRRLLALNSTADAAGVETIVPGQNLEGPGAFLTAALRMGAWQDQGYFRDEHFGPDLVLIPIDEAEEGVEHINSLKYGLAASVFGGQECDFGRLASRLRCGVVNWNRGTAGATGQLPFGGWRHSGNHRPGALFAGRLVSAVQARLHGGGSVSPFVEEALRS